MSYKITSRENILNKNEIILTHEIYGISMWRMVVCKVNTECSITRVKIKKNENCFCPSIDTPYKKERISVEGIKKLVYRCKKRERRKQVKLREKKSSMAELYL